MEHKILASRISAGEHEAFKVFFEIMYTPLLAYATTLTHDRESAKDISQQCFTNLWIKRNELDNISSIKGYLFSMAHNLYIDQYRKEKSKHRLYDELKIKALSERINEPESAADERTKKLMLLVEKLPPKCRRILLLNKKEGKKYHEIAEILGISVKTVESQMRIAYKKIRKGFNSYGQFFLLLYKLTKTVKARTYCK